ncbi:MAG: S-methyl-5-thioribose-1-phosphate isomerase [Balneolaceae bacterium]
MNNGKELYQSIIWQNDQLTIIDQTKLPGKEEYIDLNTAENVWEAIKQLKVRGAPAIGITGAYGLYLAVRNNETDRFDEFFEAANKAANYLNSSRPTAVNLSWALNHILDKLLENSKLPVSDLKKMILQTAIDIHDEDRQLCRQIGEHGEKLVPEGAQILTHCNTGGLATGQYGTAFSVIYHAHRQGKVKKVWVDETRPLLQGARLTTWELQKAGIPFSLNIDSAAAFLMKQGNADLVVIGADRITANGDTANKIGSYGLAVLANAHNIPFYVAAPYSTIDMNLQHGGLIDIEQRDPAEVSRFMNTPTAPEGIDVYNPAFDVVPHSLITAIITERGIIKPEYARNFKEMFSPAAIE